MPISATISRLGAAVLLLGGAALLFAADVLLPRLVPGVPAAAAWLGQLLGAAWLALAAMNWLQRDARLGGIYGRAVVFANLLLYFVSALSLLRVAMRDGTPRALWLGVLVFAALAAGGGALLLRGPFDRPHEATR